MADEAAQSGAVTGWTRILLRLEGVVLACAALALYRWAGGSWFMFAVLLLAPDLSMLGYLVSPRSGAIIYNAVHVTLGPALLGAIAAALREPLLAQLATIWFAHIGLDRALGYGLKYPAGFGFTHLGRIGRDKGAA